MRWKIWPVKRPRRMSVHLKLNLAQITALLGHQEVIVRCASGTVSLALDPVIGTASLYNAFQEVAARRGRWI